MVFKNLPRLYILCIVYFSFLERLRRVYQNDSNNPNNRICDRILKYRYVILLRHLLRHLHQKITFYIDIALIMFV